MLRRITPPSPLLPTLLLLLLAATLCLSLPQEISYDEQTQYMKSLVLQSFPRHDPPDKEAWRQLYDDHWTSSASNASDGSTGDGAHSPVQCVAGPADPLPDTCSWLSSWLKWCPTSSDLLREAEKRILSHLQSVEPGKYVDIGCIPDTVQESSQVWTLSANASSPSTPIVLLHGFGSGSALWCLNIDALSANRPVYALDILGFGRSSRPVFDTDAIKAEKQFVSSIEHWRRVMELDKFILVGHSFGGFLAASYAIKFPDRVAHLVLADPWGISERPLDVDERYKLPLWAKALGSVAQHFNPLSVLRFTGPLGPSIVQKARPDLTRKFSALLPEQEDAIPNYLYHCNAQQPSGETAFHSLMSGFGWAKFPMIHRLESLQPEVPMTLIYGSRSWMDRNPGFQIQYSRQNSYVDVQIIQGAGHHVYADRADRFNTLINSIGSIVDSGTLPQLPPPQQPPRAAPASADTMTNFINVRLDTVQGQVEDGEEGGHSGRGAEEKDGKRGRKVHEGEDGGDSDSDRKV